MPPTRRPSRACLARRTKPRRIGAALRLHFDLFLRFAYREIGCAGEYLHNWHIDAITYRLDEVRAGRNQRLIISMPPRHLKSITVSVAWVAWMLGRDPSLGFMCVSYGQDLADKHAYDCLKIIQSEWFGWAFPSFTLTRRAVSDFKTSAGGGRLSTSLGGVVTGRGADIIILDDPQKAGDAQTETGRETTKDWFETTLLSRLDSQEHGRILLVMQRLHRDDLAGFLLDRGGWEELRLAALATEDETIPLGNGHVYHRPEGEALHEARASRATLLKYKAANSFVFAAQHQQDPTPREGNLVSPAWFGRYAEPPTSGIVVQSWDTAVKTGVRNDWSVGITAIYYGRRYYVLDVCRARLTFTGLCDEVIARCRAYKVERLLIEDASSGQQLIQLLRDDLPTGVPYPLAIAPTTDKTSRFEAQASRIERGEVVLPEAAPWLAEFVREVASFPGDRHDDQADALAQMLANPPPTIDPPCNAGPVLFTLEDGWSDAGDEPAVTDYTDDSFNAWLQS